jgi:hypothetical protein
VGAATRNPQLAHPIRRAGEPATSEDSSSTHNIADSVGHDFSIVLGGPLYDFLLRHKLVRFALPNIFRRIATLVALTWLPLLLLSLKDALAFGHQVRIPFLYDFSIYGRFLLGLPLLLLAEVVIDPAIRGAVSEFVDARFVQDQELPEFEEVLTRVQRLRDSWIPEVALFALAFFPIFLFQHEWTTGAISSWHTTARGLTAAGWWYAVFSAPLVHFITYRWGFRYFIWAVLLWRISCLHLTLVPTHPDHAAGLNFLDLAQKNFGILFCALGCAFAGRVANSMMFEAAPISSFKFLVAGFIAISLALGLFPLALLAPKLAKVRQEGLIEYGRLANSYTALFDRKWVHNSEQRTEPLLGTSDIQSLADMGNSFAQVDAMNIVPITKRLILQLAALTALPLLPVIILGTPTPELIHAVMKMIA